MPVSKKGKLAYEREEDDRMKDKTSKEKDYYPSREMKGERKYRGKKRTRISKSTNSA